VTVYEKGGRYQFEAFSLQLTGEGELMAAFERLKAKLSEEGLFDPEHKKPIPKFPWRIGLVTSATGAAIRDLVSVSQRRNPAVELILYPARVQGEGAAEEIARAIEAFNRYRQVDLLIVGRGGGSLEDLWCFNEEIVARAIYASELPIVSAVGHEIDYSISDMVADLRAPTPSAAAEIAVPDRRELMLWLDESANRIKSTMENRIKTYRQRLEWARRSRAFGKPLELLRDYSNRLNTSRRNMVSLLEAQVEKRKSRLQSHRAALNALNPMGVLKRGYSVVRKLPEDAVISDASLLDKGSKVSMTFHRGTAVAKVEKAEENTLPL
jgi:exodeoxyribonuclease VII large subunit